MMQPHGRPGPPARQPEPGQAERDAAAGRGAALPGRGASRPRDRGLARGDRPHLSRERGAEGAALRRRLGPLDRRRRLGPVGRCPRRRAGPLLEPVRGEGATDADRNRLLAREAPWRAHGRSEALASRAPWPWPRAATCSSRPRRRSTASSPRSRGGRVASATTRSSSTRPSGRPSARFLAPTKTG